MKNENKMRGRGVQFGLKGGNQNHPKSKNQKKMTLRGRGIEVKKLNGERKKKEEKNEKEGEEKRRRKEREKRKNEKTSRPTTDEEAQCHHPSRGSG